ncbi:MULTISPECIES: ArsR/SmtB family transcription factor [Glutamicibacter]|uniref:ArsR/SmtB family transcription factor n=1 Tax=Glutamicibacter TaxID=1742989 RepID=UPI001956D7BC|nr:metalloregulator ArsR/SmtB family transcription factor [Glutamicibacter protophormiae]QRQ78549.1 winged helix-turn-helix transcriptional regulator [Glutamicibacter protophormiae]
MTATPVADDAASAACCSACAAPALAEAGAREAARLLKAIADPNRLRLLSIVKHGPADGTCVCDLTEPLQLGQPTVSHHLKILVDSGLLAREKRGTWAYYTLVPGSLDKAAALISEL